MAGIFTPQYRQHVLEVLLAELEQDRRIAAAIVVGSGATGFADEHSDIDLAAVVADGVPVSEAWGDWRRRIRELLPVWACSEVVYGPESTLLVLMLEGYLEVDLGFVSTEEVAARRPRWKVAFDRTGRVDALMRESLREVEPVDPSAFLSRRLDGIWHYVLRAAVALQRGQRWSAIHELDVIRTRAIELACLRSGLDSRHFRAVNELPEETLAALESTLPAGTSPDGLGRALRAAAELFFSQAEVVAGAEAAQAVRLRELMRQYLDAAGVSS
ncbi:nucleotidyltransferase domain-containing protein [bacterium]|nr:nucleotidyltransferase domain-containing protein [bacterium]